MLYEEASWSFNQWKTSHPEKTLDSNPFYMMGEVYNYGISGGRNYDFGDQKVDYYSHGFHSLINFELKYDADRPYAEIFKKYDNLLQGPLKGKSVLNYLTSHDDGQPYDKLREKGYRAANVLLLTPGGSQIYYGDETNRNLDIAGTEGDATLRSFMNWEDIPANEFPYVFSRIYSQNNITDQVVVGLDLAKGDKEISVGTVFKNGQTLKDAYSGVTVQVREGKVQLNSPHTIVLLEAL
jgi:alpha-amylase